MKLLVTGGAGFIGSNFVHYILREHSEWQITNLDKLTYAGNLENLKDIAGEKRYSFVKGDIADVALVDKLLQEGFDVIVNFAAESHVDRSILDAFPFLETNVKGTQVLLEGARKHHIPKFVQVSTDEVYGSVATGKSDEETPLDPASPYAASKACADLLCLAYWKTHRTPVVLTRCSNNFGPYQYPEKLIPLVVSNALDNKPIPVYGDGQNVRDWIFVMDHCRALDAVVQKGNPGEKYNVCADNEKTNLDLIHGILDRLNKPRSLIQFVADRAGHDRRYAMKTNKIERDLGWKPAHPFEESLAATVDWYVGNRDWCNLVKGCQYSEYYQKVYHQK